ncbi:ABC transporter substrate-binding protein [Halosegnis marinus]|uniref:ABC transporter substrate-binding protein n=1 Tax=Halosegnis marinus TaxID=3034023 RepID=A0ABD5ZNN4_9EURY|nr:ABC transporter substrate-binding protein [Halosegnis sp. DT85]
MAREDTRPTRRELLGAGAAVGTGLLAGCSGATGSETPTDGDAATATEGETGTATDGPRYRAELSPVGEVTLEEPPTNVFAHFPWFADMATALGQGESINSVWWDGTATAMEYFTADLDGVEIPWRDRTTAYGFSKEQLYELDSDLHLVDPAWATTQENWDRGDVEDIGDAVGPWFGNYYSNFHAEPPAAWADGYEYHSLWELFEGVAALYGERARYEALAALRADLLSTIEAGLPPESERPTAAYLSISTDLSAIYVLRLNAPGYFNAHTRPLGATDAFGDDGWDGAFQQVDMEALLEADPDVLLTLWGVTGAVDYDAMRRNLAEDDLGSELSAVRNDRVYTQGTRWQGPLMNLFQLEMTAKQLYPERFGEWPVYEEGDSYPSFDASERLFDRERLSAAVRGDV